MRRSISRRLLISNLLILIGFLGLAGVALDRAYRTSTDSATRDRLQAHVYTLLATAKEDERGRMRLPDTLAAPAFNQPDSGLYAEVFGEAGQYRWRSASLLGRSGQIVAETQPGEARFRFLAHLTIIDQAVVWEDLAGAAHIYSLSVAIDNTALQAEQQAFRNTLWGWLGGTGLLLLAAQILMIRWGLAPLRSMSKAVQALERGTAAQISGPIALELQGLAGNLNALIQQNQQRQERVRNSLADLAHSMKTPLAVLRGAAEQGAPRPLAEMIEEQTRRIDEIVSYQRQRAAVAGANRVTRPIGLLAVARRLCDSLDKVHHQRRIDCRLAVGESLQLRLDEGDLFELLGNLLENAYKHCTRNIEVAAEPVDGTIRIRIDDDGPGIGATEVQRLLQRGERADRHYPGEGIGLGVVSEIVRQYGGTLNIGASPQGGARIDILLPARLSPVG